ncbi:DUF3108 domain-containing protein [Paucibacter soli]|uniref:DUF3108 domain-containing protein n=1 Tax=Paucibacter soli TaxID=3133433 RepID=UPI0030983B28
MAGRLRRPYRRLAWTGLLAAVLLAHVLMSGQLLRLQQDWREAAAMPARLQLMLVRELRPSAPTRAVTPARMLAAPTTRFVAVAPPALAPLPAPDPTPEPLADLAPVVAAAPEPAASASLSAAVFEPGPEWPASTQLDYRLLGNYRGEVHGSAQVQWLRQGSRYQVHLDVAIGPSFAPLISRRMSSEGELTPQGIAPRRYDEDTRILFSERRRITLRFEGETLQFPNGRREAAPVGVQDTASQFVQLTWLFLTGREALQPGRVVELPLALPRRLYRWRYELLGEEELETPLGPLKTWHLRPLVQDTSGDLKAEVWLAPTLQYLPVRLRIVQDSATYVDLMLKQAPLQEASTPIVQPQADPQSKESP